MNEQEKKEAIEDLMRSGMTAQEAENFLKAAAAFHNDTIDEPNKLPPANPENPKQ
jgi:hypothetical protein